MSSNSRLATRRARAVAASSEKAGKGAGTRSAGQAPHETAPCCDPHTPLHQEALVPPADARAPADTGITDPGRSEECAEALRRILQKRDIPGSRALDEIGHLAENIGEGGELFNIEADTRAELLYWTSRLYLQHGIGGDRGENHKEQLRQLRPDHPGLPVLEAWLSCYNGDPLGALRQLEQLDHADALDSMLIIQYQEGSPREAVDWYLASPGMIQAGLSAHGIRLLAVALAHCELWDQAAEVLSGLTELRYAQCPDLLYTEGLIHIALMLPPLVRGRLLYGHTSGIHGTLEPGKMATAFHQRALWALTQAEQTLRACDAAEHADNALRLRCWLLLLDPATVHEGQKIVQEAMHDPQRAGRYIELAAEFGIMVYSKVLSRALNRNALSQGFNPAYLASRFFFQRYGGSRHKLLNMLQQEGERLQRKVFDQNTWADLYINLLIACGQYDVAEAVIYEHRHNLPWHYVPLRKLISHLRQSDNSLFEQLCNQDDIDSLKALCHDRRYHAPEALYPFILELVYKSPDPDTIVQASRCLRALRRPREQLELLDQWDVHQGRVTDDPTLLATRALALLRQGKVLKALQAIKQVQDPRAAGTLPLVMAHISGQWQHLPALLNQAREVLDRPSAEECVMLAGLSLDQDRDRALGLLLAADKQAPTDRRIQIAIYRLLRHSGNYPLAAARLGKALISRGALEPCWHYSYAELVEVLTIAREWHCTLRDMVIQGRMPLAVSCEVQGLPLAETLISRARFNESLTDRRRMQLLPVHFADRGRVDLNRRQTLAMDLGALMLAESLDLFPALLQRFSDITIPWSTLPLLHREQYQLHREQPVRIEAATHMIAPIESGLIRAELPVAVNPPSWLIDELGEERAELLETARLIGGKLILPNPVYKAYAMSCELAETGPYKNLVISIRQYMDWSSRGSNRPIPEGTMEVLNDLEDADQGAAVELDGPVLVDEQALERIYQCRLMGLLENGRQPLFMHPNVPVRLREIIGLENYRDHTVATLEALRQRLAMLLAEDALALTPVGRDAMPGTYGAAITELLGGDTLAQVYWVEDRCLGSGETPHPSDRRSKCKAGILDILHDLHQSGIIDDDRHYKTLNSLRAMGCYLLPVEIDELNYWLQDARVQDGVLHESAGLRHIRHYLQRLISSHWIQVPAESYFLERLHLSVIREIRDLWLDETIPVGDAAARASWLVDNIFPNLAKWRHALEKGMNLYFFEDATAMYIAAFLALQPGDPDRGEAFRDWLNSFLLSDFRLRNFSVMHKTTEFHKKQLLGLAGIEYDTDDHDHHH